MAMGRQKAKVYHYSKCMTCRRSIDALSKSYELELRDIFKDRLSKDEMKAILARAGLSARDLLRKRSRAYMDIVNGNYDDEEIIEMMIRDPSLIERPIVIVGEKVFIRPEFEKVR